MHNLCVLYLWVQCSGGCTKPTKPSSQQNNKPFYHELLVSILFITNYWDRSFLSQTAGIDPFLSQTTGINPFYHKLGIDSFITNCWDRSFLSQTAGIDPFYHELLASSLFITNCWDRSFLSQTARIDPFYPKLLGSILLIPNKELMKLGFSATVVSVCI